MGEGSDRGEPGVAGANNIAADALKVIQEGENIVGAKLLEGQLVDGLFVTLGEKAEENPEGIAVGGDGPGADVALGAEVVGEESFDENGKTVWGTWIKVGWKIYPAGIAGRVGPLP